MREGLAWAKMQKTKRAENSPQPEHHQAPTFKFFSLLMRLSHLLSKPGHMRGWRGRLNNERLGQDDRHKPSQESLCVYHLHFVMYGKKALEQRSPQLMQFESCWAQAVKILDHLMRSVWVGVGEKTETWEALSSHSETRQGIKQKWTEKAWRSWLLLREHHFGWPRSADLWLNPVKTIVIMTYLWEGFWGRKSQHNKHENSLWLSLVLFSVKKFTQSGHQ